MKTFENWRELLETVIRDPGKRQRIAQTVKVNPVTLTRWATGKSLPRRNNIDPLLEALPEQRESLSKLIAKDFPDFFSVEKTAEEKVKELPAHFYARVLHTYTSHPPIMRSMAITQLVLQQIVAQLDPQKQGIAVYIAQCVYPGQERKIHSLRSTVGRGTPPWGSHLEHSTLFLGAESQAGHALRSGLPVLVQSQAEKKRRFPTHPSADTESVAAFPILMADQAAGNTANAHEPAPQCGLSTGAEQSACHRFLLWHESLRRLLPGCQAGVQTGPTIFPQNKQHEQCRV